MAATNHPRVTELQARWREVFCTCADEGHDPMYLGCAIMRQVTAEWGVLGLEHMVRRAVGPPRPILTED